MGTGGGGGGGSGRSTRRRSHGEMFAEEEVGGGRDGGGVPAAKRRREDKGGSGKGVGSGLESRTAGTGTAKSAGAAKKTSATKVFEENDDGFFFTRRTVKPKTTKAAEIPATTQNHHTDSPIQTTRSSRHREPHPPPPPSDDHSPPIRKPSSRSATNASQTTTMQRRSSGRLNKNRSGSDDRPASPAPRPALKSQKPSKSQPQPQSQSHSRTRSRKEEQLSKPDSNHHQPHHHQNNHQNSRYHSEFEDAMAEAGFTPRSPSPPRRHPRSPVGNTAKIALPVSDTPIIRRNQQFRQNAGGGGGNRRSSIGMRGRRASSLMDSGIVAEPHPNIPTREYYKHINGEIVEPRRMMQLLVWCGKKALEATERRNQGEGNAYAIARLIKDELQKELKERPEMSNWFKRDESLLPPPVRKPNPRNIENIERVAENEEKLKVLQNEKEAWQALLGAGEAPTPLPIDPAVAARPSSWLVPSIAGAERNELSENRDDNNNTSTSTPDDLTAASTTTTSTPPTAHLLPPESTFALTTLPHITAINHRITTRIASKTSQIEYETDLLDDGVNVIEQFDKTAERYGGQILRQAEGWVGRRDEAVKKATRTEGVPMMEVLRSLSRVV